MKDCDYKDTNQTHLRFGDELRAPAFKQGKKYVDMGRIYRPLGRVNAISNVNSKDEEVQELEDMYQIVPSEIATDFLHSLEKVVVCDESTILPQIFSPCFQP